MNGFSNADTYLAALKINNDENLYFSAKRLFSSFALKNLVADAIEAGHDFGDMEIENVDFEELLDSVTED